ncbi:MAG: hypothetical protein AAF587_45015 [Bacteroidota bacterium]
MNQTANKLLSYRGQFGGRNKSGKLIGHNIESHSYYKQCMLEGEDGEHVLEKDFKSSKYMKVMETDLSNTKKRIGEKSNMVRALNPRALKKMRRSLGSTYAIANPDPVPTLKDIKKGENPNVSIDKDTVIRMVTLEEEHVDAEVAKNVLPVSAVSSQFNTGTETDDAELRKIARQQCAKNCKFPGIMMTHVENDLGQTELKTHHLLET